ncbi:MAG TPA: four helix bundle protein [Candidatus Polarisedimenticolaceae bacterium]|nr:four helix bundle protein [Candidatus Polarisedimenticolaceae bacterium]
MDALMPAVPEAPADSEAGRRVRAFRATDHFAVAVYQAVKAFARPEGEDLAREIRGAVARSGGSLVAAASAAEDDPDAKRALASAHRGMLEIRYFLYLARRLGCLDLKRYRQLATLQDAALRELAALLA